MISSGQYLFFTGLIYFLIGMFDIMVYRFAEPEVIQACWIFVLMIPTFLPIGKFVRGAPFIRNV